MRLTTLAFAASLTLVAACSSDNPTPSGTNNSGSPMSASINGTQWSATTASASASSNVISISGLRLTAPNYTVGITLSNVASTGTYPLGVNATNFGGQVVVSNLTGGWSTPINGAAGQINITTLSSSRIAGTFSFNATPISQTTGNLTVTGGSFDVPLSGTLPVLAPNAGSKLSATINGAAYNAGTAAVAVAAGTTSTIAIAAGNLARNISILLSNVTGTGTYTLAASPARTIQITDVSGSQAPTWASQIAGGSGSVNVTTFSTSRVIGTFTATLVPLGGGATGNLTVTGSFDLGRP